MVKDQPESSYQQ